ncbi:MAG: hypothetical protein A2509_11125 [Candidatus Edwardsbacteria bacterium RIFOXYD12_FULL_50_11]|uniref:Uncharacterized protein n=1 Tax=Candidatus Edwardsbacteria bacterium GWF2_54_11 TaxID=1817851 RepID=A0A1F5R9M7_9BACT|nr:MAG: hypothetical protein A2502_11885 [Candidatus Edwardsbacteria bacterium RifOxyC12_full_54_24]OGF08208.1 MAG: hypothetical protein A2273_07625 [Candidatus Edwardsbacteria bacterium RifOxyA12_full_54_48]OGF11138.1 MAG: hypothetical protein A2024_07685 [Candidatus Edwardsbacteria bacterium GWF2_54_11]OGF11505.1 MAG: hypothetical protein A3K15_04095 [Candidatus Edwardsbacteria bacterium GWE2_54_12]OGF14807.1 MAG: hypothetical protein A2509_11125 [Candidatus Edwardsbacteria bacterium RIFOXYD1
MHKLSVAVIYVQYEPEKHNGSLSFFRGMLDRIQHDFRFVIIDNKIGNKFPETLADGTILIGGDNSIYDFSGWQKGVQWIDGRNEKYDLIIFANDSYPLNINEYKGCLNSNLFYILKKYNLSAGVIYNSNYRDWRRYFVLRPDEYRIGGCSFNYWVRSNFMIMPYNVRKIMKSVNEATNNMISPEYNEQNIFSDQVSRSLQKHILTYLCPEKEEDPKYIWHSRFVLARETYQHFRIKARVLLCEKLLGPYALSSDSFFVDIRTIGILHQMDRFVPRLVCNIIHWLKTNPNRQIYYLFIFKRFIKYVRKNI